MSPFLGPGARRRQVFHESMSGRAEKADPPRGNVCPGWEEETMSDTISGRQAPSSTRWLQLIVGIICMSMIANLQYGWTLFVAPIDAKFGWGRAAIQVAFSIFVLTETWLVPIEGWFVDRFGPRIVVVIGGEPALDRD